jgi:murein DD-endopeptidase MepM/ murein hydrolase activator NlpD
VTVRGLSALLVVLLAVGAASLVWWRCEGEAPRVEGPEALAVGRDGAEVTLGFSDAGSGLRRVRVVLQHAGGEEVLQAAAELPGSLISGSTRADSEETASVRIDPKALGLSDGDAFLVAEAVDWSWRSMLSGNVTTLRIPVSIDLKPPRVRVEGGLTYVRRGGAASVVYELDETAERDGVEVGEVFFPGFPFPGAAPPGAGAPARRFAIFAVPRDAPPNPPIRVVAEDAAGNRTTARWATRVQERSFEDVRINLGEPFLESKVPNLAASLEVDAGDPVAAFQEINTRIRQLDEERVAEIVAESVDERLWSGAFHQLRNSAVTSRFAEHRRYFRKGEPVSEAIHYGYDLASTAQAPITAANTGRVIFAGDLGIYGNCVVLDHGGGLTSLYAHLSRIDVSEGDPAQKDAVLGLSGASGLAGGDHLHFAILVNGVYVDPKEWWDPKWVREHVEVRLAPPAS